MKNVTVLFAALGIVATDRCLADSVDLDDIELPDGFVIEKFADVPNARSLALGNKGVIFVSNRRATSVYAVVPQGDANPSVFEILEGLSTPNGIAYFAGDLYVAEINRILRYRNVEDALPRMPFAEVLPVELPSERHHGWRYISFGPDGKLYVGIGAPCNICDRGAEGFAQIWRMNADGSNLETYAQGVRNTVGFTWHPQTNQMWFTDNGRDMLGDDLPPDELNIVTQVGQHFGYPFCHGGDLLDPEFGEGRSCSEFTPPVQKLAPHTAALGLKFYDGTMFPPEYRGQLFIAEHGSWNRSKKIGYRVMKVRLQDGMPASYEPFAEGWLRKEKVTGRPVDLLVLDDGSMLVSDDLDGKLFRIYYEGQ